MRAYFQEMVDRRNVRRLMAADTPAFCRRPFDYLAQRCFASTPAEESVFAAIELQREKMKTVFIEEVAIYYSPKPQQNGGMGRPAPGKVKSFDVRRIASHTSVSPYWGRFLHLLAAEAKAKRVLGLGTCAGISGCYLATAPSCEQFWTIEASADLCAIARTNLSAVTNNFKVLNGFFDDELDKLLPTLPKRSLDLVWIDGHHEQVATIHYFDRIRPWLADGAIVLFDDISWSADMRKCWDKLSVTPGFSQTFDLKTLKGMGIWRGGDVAPTPRFVAKPFGEVKIGKPPGWNESQT